MSSKPNQPDMSGSGSFSFLPTGLDGSQYVVVGTEIAYAQHIGFTGESKHLPVVQWLDPQVTNGGEDGVVVPSWRHGDVLQARSQTLGADQASLHSCDDRRTP